MIVNKLGGVKIVSIFAKINPICMKIGIYTDQNHINNLKQPYQF